MANFTDLISARFNLGSMGTLLVPTYWVPAVEMNLPTYTMWNQFVSNTYGGAEVFGQRQGQYFKVHVLGQLGLTGTSALVTGTKVAVANSNALTEVVGTLHQYGYAEQIDQFNAWLASADIQKADAVALAENAMACRDALVGATFLATTNYFTCNGTGTASKGTYTGTTGTQQLLPTHVRQIVSDLRRMGIPTFSDGYYVCVGAPGMFDALKASSEVAEYTPLEDVYLTGQVLTFNGVHFIEEVGANAKTTYSATSGTSIIFGANAVVGGDNFLRPDLIRYYADVEEDFGRCGKIGWTAVGGWCRPFDSSTDARAWLVYHAGS